MLLTGFCQTTTPAVDTGIIQQSSYCRADRVVMVDKADVLTRKTKDELVMHNLAYDCTCNPGKRIPEALCKKARGG
jgi:hypothetical protein